MVLFDFFIVWMTQSRWHNSLVCLEFISLSAHVCQLLCVCLFSSGCHITGRDSLPDPLWETSLLYPCNIWFNKNIFLPWMILIVFKAFNFYVELIPRNTWSSWIGTRNNVRNTSFQCLDIIYVDMFQVLITSFNQSLLLEKQEINICAVLYF